MTSTKVTKLTPWSLLNINQKKAQLDWLLTGLNHVTLNGGTHKMEEAQLNLPRKNVKKSNALIRGNWSPQSIWEPRLVALVASMIHQDDEEFKEYCFPVSKLCGEKYLSGEQYKDIKAAVKNIMKSSILLEEGSNFMAYTIFSKCGYKNGRMVAAFHPDLKPHFMGLQKNFTQYSLRDYMKLPSTYSQRIFEILKSWDDKPETKIQLSALHDMLNSPPSLRSRYQDFRRKVLEKSYTDIHKYTTLRYEWEPIKTGRKITAIRFVFSKHRKNEIIANEKETQEKKKQKAATKRHQAALEAAECYKNGNCNPNGSLRCTICKQFFGTE